MNDPRNPNVLAKQGQSAAIKHEIRAVLTNELAEWSIDPDKVYINGVTDPVEKLVIYCRSLSDAAWECVYENIAFNFSTETSGLFNVAYSYADEHRVSTPAMAKVAQVINALVQKLG
jgi:hypothetical protein